MNTRIAVLAVALGFSTVVYAATAYLVSSRIGTSITGQGVLVCTYQYGGSHFERVFPFAVGTCPMSVEVY